MALKSLLGFFALANVCSAFQLSLLQSSSSAQLAHDVSLLSDSDLDLKEALLKQEEEREEREQEEKDVINPIVNLGKNIVSLGNWLIAGSNSNSAHYGENLTHQLADKDKKISASSKKGLRVFRLMSVRTVRPK